MNTATVELTKLRPHPDNPRLGDTDTIAESLRVNGQYTPLVLSNDGYILVGNHRYQAMLELGWTHAQVVAVDHPHNAPEAKRIMLADNRTSDLGGYDTAALLDLLDDPAMTVGTGYHTDDLHHLRDQLDRDLNTPLDYGDLTAPTRLLSINLTLNDYDTITDALDDIINNTDATNRAEALLILCAHATL